MKFKCGKCGQLGETSSANTIDSTDQFMTVKCGSCGVLNKLPRPSPAPLPIHVQIPLSPTVIVSKDIAKEKVKPVMDAVPGWIFVHDENTPQQSFNLKVGKNIVGRKSSVFVEIPIETSDEYMSRRHCLIDVVLSGGRYEFRLSDFKALNGTFINGLSPKRLRTEDIILLNDGDTVQLGMTKVVIRINNSSTSRDDAELEVGRSSYAPTVVVKRM